MINIFNMPRQAVSIIIFRNHRTELLLTKRRDVPVWVLPGGGIELGEKPEEAAIREALEETGLNVAICRQVARYDPRNRLSQITFFYECAIQSGHPIITNETADIAFFPIHALPKMLAPPYAYWIRDALRDLPELMVKKMEGTSYWHFFYHLTRHPILTLRFLLTRFGIHINS